MHQGTKPTGWNFAYYRATKQGCARRIKRKLMVSKIKSMAKLFGGNERASGAASYKVSKDGALFLDREALLSSSKIKVQLQAARTAKERHEAEALHAKANQ